MSVQANSLEPDDIKSISVDVVLDRDERPHHAGGRPRKLDVRKFLKICSWIQQGKCNTLACKIEDVDYSGFRAHIRNKPWWQKRYAHADQVRDEYLRDIHLANIIRHSAQNWQASAWILERKFPGEFSLKQVVRDTGDAESQPLCERISLTQLTENARLMAETLANPPPGLLFHEEPDSRGSDDAGCDSVA